MYVIVQVARDAYKTLKGESDAKNDLAKVAKEIALEYFEVSWFTTIKHDNLSYIMDNTL